MPTPVLTPRFLRTFAVLLALLMPAAQAHHSFAVHFVSDDLVEVSGTVKEFRFSNPHGVLTFEVMDANGQVLTWRAETNSPSVLRRRGWSKDSLKPGEAITVLGFPARDDSNYMRISKVTFADGRELLGQAQTAPAEDQD
jgi:hypothetical protein